MTRNDIANTLKRKRHCLKQIGEALKLVEDLDWRIAWALDFSEHGDINDALSPVGEALSNAQEELEEVQGRIEEQIEEFRSRVNMAEIEIAQDVLA
jgi:hypothetical protein